MGRRTQKLILFSQGNVKLDTPSITRISQFPSPPMPITKKLLQIHGMLWLHYKCVHLMVLIQVPPTSAWNTGYQHQIVNI